MKGQATKGWGAGESIFPLTPPVSPPKHCEYHHPARQQDVSSNIRAKSLSMTWAPEVESRAGLARTRRGSTLNPQVMGGAQIYREQARRE